MSVAEMRRLLGLGKTDSYWLVHQGFFKTILVNGKMRVVIDSFEEWYAMQTKHHKVTGEEPGIRLRQESYSVQEISELLGISKDQARYIIKNAELPVFKVHCQYQVPKKAFNEWLASQSHYVLKQEKATALGSNYITMPQMAQRLGVERDTVYSILKSELGKAMIETVTVGDRRYVEVNSFSRWLDNQSKYRLTAKPQRTQLHKPKNPAYYTVDEIIRFYGIRQVELYEKLRDGSIPAIKVGNLWRIKRDEFDKLLMGRSEE